MTVTTGTKPDLSAAELSLEVARERINPNAFDGLGIAMQDIKLAATLGISEVLPVGGLVTGAGKALLLDEGFEQDRPIGVADLPVFREPAADRWIHGRMRKRALFTMRCRLRCR